MQDIRQSKEWQAYMQSLGWEVVRARNIVGYKKSLPVLGAIIKFQRCPIPDNLHALVDVGRRHRAFLIKLEPTEQLPHQSLFRKTAMPTMPTRTIFIDLQPPLHTLWRGLRASTKTKVNKARRAAMEITESKDIHLFASHWSRASKRRGLWVGQTTALHNLWDAFPVEKKMVLLARNGDSVQSGILLLFHDRTASYMYAFTTEEGRRTTASSLLTWEAIVRSKARGNVRFDFEGIYDEKSSLKSWKGFTFFKTGFGGRAVQFHSYTKTTSWTRFPLVKELF